MRCPKEVDIALRLPIILTPPPPAKEIRTRVPALFCNSSGSSCLHSSPSSAKTSRGRTSFSGSSFCPAATGRTPGTVGAMPDPIPDPEAAAETDAIRTTSGNGPSSRATTRRREEMAETGRIGRGLLLLFSVARLPAPAMHRYCFCGDIWSDSTISVSTTAVILLAGGWNGRREQLDSKPSQSQIMIWIVDKPFVMIVTQAKDSTSRI